MADKQEKKYDIKIEKKSPVPVYMQLADQIIENIERGLFYPGAKLPSTRELAECLDISRGTVKKAYLNLINNKKAASVKGRGTFVTEAVNHLPVNRLEQASDTIETTISRLEDMHFSHFEIATLFNSIISLRSEALANFAIAAIDCNPEALNVYQRQIALLNNIKIVKYLLRDIISGEISLNQLEVFDLIVTTNTHYQELQSRLPDLDVEIIQVGVAPTAKTLVEMGTINSSQKIGILYNSKRYKEIIEKWLAKFHSGLKLSYFSLQLEEKLEDFVKNIDLLIIPPSFSLGGIQQERIFAIRDFRQRGGRIINFEYKIEPGSLVYLENKIKITIKEKRKSGNKL
ncbi:MAG: GntR family transcriptional regulator [Deltaproteobacteria bacterium]|jgi:DNA-binding transcriptional regulator YhcF (GntR family)|nr:GntR family transcriptional regulator [Deltaproteobacteria bacterium]